MLSFLKVTYSTYRRPGAVLNTSVYWFDLVLTTPLWGRCYYSFLQVRKLRDKEATYFPRGLVSRKWQTWDSDPSSLTPHLISYSTSKTFSRMHSKHFMKDLLTCFITWCQPWNYFIILLYFRNKSLRVKTFLSELLYLWM